MWTRTPTAATPSPLPPPAATWRGAHAGWRVAPRAARSRAGARLPPPPLVASRTHLEVRVLHVLKHEAGRLGVRVAHHIQQLDDVGAATQVLQDLDLALDLLLLDGLEDLDDAALLVDRVVAVKDLRVLAAPDLAHHLVVLLVAPVHHERLVVPVLARALGVHVRVDARARHGVAPPVVVGRLAGVLRARRARVDDAHGGRLLRRGDDAGGGGRGGRAGGCCWRQRRRRRRRGG